jgi:hypothetical protein
MMKRPFGLALAFVAWLVGCGGYGLPSESNAGRLAGGVGAGPEVTASTRDAPSGPGRTPGVLTTLTAGANGQPTLDPRYANYRSSRRDQLGLYQGDLRNLGRNVDEVARTLRPFDVLVLTNIFPVKYVGPAAPPVAGRVDATQGTCASGGLPDGWSATALLRALRAGNPEVKIYGYVPSTADLYVGPDLGCTSNLSPYQNFVCPGGVCSDFVRWVDTWHSLEAGDPAARLDGIFVDLVNEAFIATETWANEVSYVHGRTNAAGAPYRLLANMTAYNRPGEGYFYAHGVGPVVGHSVSSVAFAAAPMVAGDAIYREAFLLVAGTYETDGVSDMMNELVDGYRARGILWAASASELGNTYVPPSNVDFTAWQNAGYISPGSCYVGPTGETLTGGRSYSTCSVALVPPTLCGTQNESTVYAEYKAWADFGGTVGAGGGLAFAFTEARLGYYTGVVPFCANDP